MEAGRSGVPPGDLHGVGWGDAAAPARAAEPNYSFGFPKFYQRLQQRTLLVGNGAIGSLRGR